MTKSEEIAESIFLQISSGALTGRLSSEQKLAKQYGVSPVTAAKALNILRERGVVTRVHGSGTFVSEPEQTVVRIMFNYSFAEKLFSRLTAYFPQVKIEAVDSMEKADAVVFSTTVPFFPGEYFLPWPRERIDRLKQAGRLYPKVFEFHDARGAIWGLPYFFSPDILLYNKKLMQQINPGFEPYEMTFESMLELQKKLPEGVALYAGYLSTLLLPFVYNLAGDGVAGPEIFRKAVALKDQLDCRNDVSEFLEGRALFSSSTRYQANRIGTGIDIAPMMKINNRRVCHASSEAFMIRNTTRHADLLFDMAEALFKPEIQQMISDARRAIPADVVIAAKSLDSSVFRDDIFFNEIKNIDFAHRHMSDSVNLCFSAVIKKMVQERITADEFLREVEIAYLFEEKRQNALHPFTVSSCAVGF